PAGDTRTARRRRPRPYGERRSGEIESPEMPAEGVKVEKIYHVAESDPIPEIAERPSEHQGKSRREKALARMPGEEKHDGDGRSDGYPDEQRPLPAARVGEEAESGAAVVREHQVEERRDLAHLAE